eukprot:COSAG04_NODE_1660_length_6022_cov_5.271146_3_plen_384_part_00
MPAAEMKRRSSSELTAPKATAVHTLRLRAIDTLPAGVGQKMDAAEFIVGGEKFQVRVYLGGEKEEDKEHVSLYLRYCGSRDGVETSYTLAMRRADRAEPVEGLTFSLIKFATRNDNEKKWVSNWGNSQFARRSELFDGWAAGVAKDVTIEAEVTVWGEAKASSLELEEDEVAKPADQVMVPMPALGSSFLDLLESGDLADVKLKSGDATVYAHKLILSARSPVFAAMFERGMAEAEASEVTLEGVTPHSLYSLVHFLYSEELREGAMDEAEALLAAADQYEVPRLVALCERELCGVISQGNAARLLVLADRHRAAQLKEACLDYIALHAEGVMTSEGWQQLGTQPNLLQELFAHKAGVRKRPAGASGGGEGAQPQSKRQRTTQ